MPLNIECRIPANDSVRLLRHFIGGMDLRELHSTYSRIEKKKASPRQMLAIAVYANMNGIRSSRKIESACKRDINFMYLLEGKPAPDHSAIARFRQLHLAPCMKTLFAVRSAATSVNPHPSARGCHLPPRGKAWFPP